MKKEAVISFDGVSKYYSLYRQIRGIKHFIFELPKNLSFLRDSQFEALRDITFDIYEGENFGIIGNNGAGKSTLLSLVAGVLKPNKGRVVVRGKISPLLALGAGFHPDLTGRENIKLNGVLLGLTRRQIKEKLDEIIEFAEIGNFIDHPTRVYSSGMLARLGFSVIAHLDPEILLIDEVLAVGDIRFQKKCFDKMLSFKESGVTMVLVTHSIPSVVDLCDRTLWLENHAVKMLGPSLDVARGYCEASGVNFDDLISATPAISSQVYKRFTKPLFR